MTRQKHHAAAQPYSLPRSSRLQTGKATATNDGPSVASMPGADDDLGERLSQGLLSTSFQLLTGPLTESNEAGHSESVRGPGPMLLPGPQAEPWSPASVSAAFTPSGQQPQWTPDAQLLAVPSLPNRTLRQVYGNLKNPYAEDSEEYVKALPAQRMPPKGKVDSYVKFTYSRGGGSAKSVPSDFVGRLPPNFALGCPLNHEQLKLFTFYIGAWCNGRTLIPRTNSWRNDFGRMFSASPALQHAIFALSAVYILDYMPVDVLRKSTNFHYNRAVALVSYAMQDPTYQAVGRGDEIIAALATLNMIDVVNWECRRPAGQPPRWQAGALEACRMLDISDPGWRYWDVEMAQVDDTRRADAIIVGRSAVLGLLMTPLDRDNTRSRFSWLLRGTRADVFEIHGMLGFSPKLLHMIAQITHTIAGLAEEESDKETYLASGNALFGQLQKLQQPRCWKDHAPERTTAELIEWCQSSLNPEGYVTDADHMIDLGARAWLIATQIYCLCRFLRLPRTHADVRSKAEELALCIKHMPCSGHLFTAQAPLFPVFLLGLVAMDVETSRIARDWFEMVTNANSCRSSVPPVYAALKRIQAWRDAWESTEMDIEVPVPEWIPDRVDWWEEMVSWVVENIGVLCLF